MCCMAVRYLVEGHQDVLYGCPLPGRGSPGCVVRVSVTLKRVTRMCCTAVRYLVEGHQDVLYGCPLPGRSSPGCVVRLSVTW